MNFNYGLYPVITSEFCKNRDMIKVLKEIIAGGAKIVQLREKNKSKNEIYKLALKYRDITANKGVTLIINDHVDIALAVGADGVHLGQDDLPVSVAKLIAPNLMIGISTHSPKEIKDAETDGATYINIGPIFKTGTKKTGVEPLGVDYLKKVKSKLPFSVMGGIKKNNLEELLRSGAKNIAMVTEITMADDIRKTVENLISIINNFK
jgi:thiamine-phosphate pyrophosphorylase